MHKHKSAVVARRAWNSLRLALLWARRGGHFKNRRLMVDLRLLPKFINRTLGTTSSSNDYYRHRRGALHYGERQLSFDDTPVIHFKMHRPSSLRFKMPNIPCITGAPQVDFDDYDFDRHDCSGTGHDTYYLSEAHNDVALSGKSILLKAAGDYITSDEEEEGDDDDRSNTMVCDHQETNETPRSCDDGIDLKAEQFIANFYRQIKLQRQISYLQYHDMISRGAS
ncbi:uncharacterized protein LOC113748593 [Coffea eugenioides]|uniref:uncharacterized protein LOC113748593 n=1 Tax=Coffea eugenioides TaxID=49369 RepID=UPI000F60D663|nr:uncharacterized protein LOC113748593 [Coffea eugenioides]